MYFVELSLTRPENILTTREEEVLIELILGKNNTEIAADLFISISTAKFHVSSILKKFGVKRRSHAMIKALREGWVNIQKKI